MKLLKLVANLSLVVAFQISLSNFAIAEERTPNIIYILLDDAGYGDLSCFGQKKFKTPNIDELASRGMRFTQHYAGSTVCAPTRSALMTGLHTGHTFIRGNREIQPEGQTALPAGTVTMPKLLQKAGYVTGAFGKWGLGAPGSEGDPTRQGFEKFYGYNCQREAHNYYPTHLWNNREKVELDGKTYAHDVIMDEALKFVRTNKDKPFFCFLPITIPHAAMQVPAKYADPFRKKFSQFEDEIGEYAGTEVENPVAGFAGMMTKMDEDVGRVVSLLNELGLAEDTIILLSSDNGPHIEGGHNPKFFDSNGPFRGFKRDLYEGGIRVPLIATWPEKIKPGTESGHACAHWDLLPTFCELAKAKTPEKVDGISFLPTLLGKESQKKHDYLYWEYHGQGGKQAVLFDDWKVLHLNLNKVEAKRRIEVFNLGNDLGEKNNVADANPEIVARAKKMFTDSHVPSKFWKFGNKNPQ